MISLFQGPFSAVTFGFILVTVLFFIIACLFLINKKKRIIDDFDKLEFPLDAESLKDSAIGRLILENSINRTMEDTDDVVNISSVAAAYGLNLRLFQSIPSMLTSLGILGTFVGLTLSVHSFDSSTSEGIRASIETLLGGMSTAFWTSVAGMSCSVLFLWVERKTYNNLCNLVEMLSTRIHKEHPLSVNDTINTGLENILGRIDGLNASLNANMTEAFDNKIIPMVSEIADKLENPAQTVVDSLIKEFKSITNNFADHLTEKVNNKMNELLEQFILATESMKNVPGAIDQATENLIKSGENCISIQKVFTEETQNHISVVMKELTEAVKSQFITIEERIKSISDSMNDVPEEINRSVEAQRVVADELSVQVKNLQEFEHFYSNALKTISEANKDVAEAKTGISSLVSEVSEVVETIKEFASSMSENNQKMLFEFEDIKNTNELITKQVKEYGEHIAGFESGLKGIFAEIDKGLKLYSTTIQNNMQHLLDKYTTSLTSATQSISNATSPMHEAVSGILNALEKSHSSATLLLNRIETLAKQLTDTKE